MWRRRCKTIEIKSLEPERLEVTIHSRLVTPPGPLDWVIAVLIIFSACTGLGVAMLGLDAAVIAAAPAALLALVVGGVGAGVVRRIKPLIGPRHRLTLAMDPGSMRGQPLLRIGEREVEASAVDGIALLGWQEVAATDRLWDVTVLLKEGSSTVVSGHSQEDPARELAQALATALHVELKESSTTGGSTSTMSFDQRGLPKMK